MPFGLVFGALFFCVLTTWLGLQFLLTPSAPARAAGVLLVALGLALGIGLLMRRGWARWSGVACCLGLALFAVWLVDQRSGTLDMLMLFASAATFGLLVHPATGDVRRGAPENTASSRGRANRLFGVTTAFSSIGLLGLALWAYQGPAVESEGPVVLPASLAGQRVSWSDFASGLSSARNEGKPMLVTFVASWCGYCKKMDRTTWKHPSVVERLESDVIAVRVDTEDAVERGGFSGTELAGRYQVHGTPTQLLLGADGRILSLAGGFQSARDLLDWLDRSLVPSGSRSTARVSGP